MEFVKIRLGEEFILENGDQKIDIGKALPKKFKKTS